MKIYVLELKDIVSENNWYFWGCYLDKEKAHEEGLKRVREKYATDYNVSRETVNE